MSAVYEALKELGRQPRVRARPSVYSLLVRNLRMFTDLLHHDELWIIGRALVQRCVATRPEDKSSDDPMMLILAELRTLNRTMRVLTGYLMDREPQPTLAENRTIPPMSDDLPQRLPESIMQRLREMEPTRRDHLLGELRRAWGPEAPFAGTYRACSALRTSNEGEFMGEIPASLRRSRGRRWLRSSVRRRWSCVWHTRGEPGGRRSTGP